jgi:corrinoid protein of di/trimethylamine methyltransferase
VPDTTVIQNLEQSIIDGDVESAEKWAQQAIDEKIDVYRTINEGLIKGIRKVGDAFGNAELFLPDLILSSEAMKAASDILEEELKKSGVKVQSTVGKIVIGTVKGDVHDIGKTLVATLFKAYGFHVIDMGVDVPKEHFVEAVKEHQPDILGLSSLLTTSAAEQRDVIEALQKARLRSQVKIIVGGGAISEQWSNEIGADGYGGDAREAVDIGNKLLALS